MKFHGCRVESDLLMEEKNSNHVHEHEHEHEHEHVHTEACGNIIFSTYMETSSAD
jgi:hypothetical protein